MSVAKKALIMVDIQNDFCLGGKFAVSHGEDVVPYANLLQPHFELIIATKDWHPADHKSFASQHSGKQIGEVVVMDKLEQVLWPEHCIQGTPGAEFHPHLDTKHIHRVFYKGTDKHIDSYSAFFDNAHLRATGLGDFLHAEHIEDIYIMGLTTDYCIKYSALDGLGLNFHVYVIQDACRGIELRAGDSDRALKEMQEKGAKLIYVRDVTG